MTQAMTKKATNWMPAERHKRSQNTLVFTPVDELVAVVDTLMRISSRTDYSEAPPPLARGHCGTTMWVMSIAAHIHQSAQRLERRAKLRREDLRLLPGREVAALVDLVVIDELGIRPLRPAPRGLIELVRKGAHRGRDGDVFRGEKRELALPIETSRRDRRVRQPVE